MKLVWNGMSKDISSLYWVCLVLGLVLLGVIACDLMKGEL